MDDPSHGFWEQVPTWPIWGFFAIILGSFWKFIGMRRPEQQHHEAIVSAAANGDVIGLIRQLLETSARTERKFDDFRNRIETRFDDFDERLERLEHPTAI